MIAAISQPEKTFWLLACAGFVVLGGFFSGSETGLYCVNRLRLRLAVHEGRSAAKRLQQLLIDLPGILFTTLLGTNAANCLAPICLVYVFLSAVPPEISPEARAAAEHSAELFTTLALTPIMFIFGEVVPKNVFQRQADRYMLAVAAPLAAAHWVCKAIGLIRLQKILSRLVISRLHQQPASGSLLHPRLEMYQMLRDGAAEGALTAAQTFILQRIPALKALRVASVMTPRSSAVMLNAISPSRLIRETIRRNPYSRLPVYRGDPANVIGVVHVLDVLTGPEDAPLSDHVKPPLTLTHTTPVMKALTTLQRARQRMAIVVDNSGRCLGLITIKDLVEEIVGELAAW